MSTLTISGSVDLATLEAANASFFNAPADARGAIVPVGNILQGDPTLDLMLTCNNRSLGIYGGLRLRPNAGKEHVIRFTNINEQLFTGAAKRTVTTLTIALESGVYYGYATVALPTGWPSQNITTDDNVLVEGDSNAAVNGTYRCVQVTGAQIKFVYRSFNADGTLNTGPSGILPNPGAPSGSRTIRANDHQWAKNDIGLYVLGTSGFLDLQGADKVTWTRVGAAVSGTNPAITATEFPADGVTLDTLIPITPTGWVATNEVGLTPTAIGNLTSFPVLPIASVVGTTVNLTGSAGTNLRPMVTPQGKPTRGCEMANLTHTVRIEGTPTGYTHVMLHAHAASVSFIKNVGFRYLGPRHILSTSPFKDEKLTGRWGLHLHKAEDNLVGSTFENIVFRDMRSHAAVAHASNYITWKRCVFWNCIESPGWWDPDVSGDAPHNVLYDGCLVAGVPGPVDQDRLFGFSLGIVDNPGPNCGIKNSVACGVHAPSGRDSSGYGWPEGSPPGPKVTNKIWDFGNNAAHNNDNGAFIWMNDGQAHDMLGLETYCNADSGITFGAYSNTARWLNVGSFGNGWAGGTSAAHIILHSVGKIDSRGFWQQWTGSRARGGYDLNGGDRFINIPRSPLPTVTPSQMQGIDIVNLPSFPIIRVGENEGPPAANEAHKLDFAQVRLEDGAGWRDLEPSDFQLDSIRGVSTEGQGGGVDLGFTVRVQRDLADPITAWEIYSALDGTNVQPSSVGIDDADVAPWATSHAYVYGDLVRPTTPNGKVFACVSPGTSHASTQPTWPAARAWVTDGTVTWVLAEPTLSEIAPFALHISTSSVLAPGASGVAYTNRLDASLGVGPYTDWEVIDGTCPYTLDPDTGDLTGTSTDVGDHAFSAQVMDARGVFAVKDFSLTVAATAPAVVISTPSSLPPGVVGTPFSMLFDTIGAVGAVTWAVISGTQTAGLAFTTPAGTFAGTPSSDNGDFPYTFTVQATDSDSPPNVSAPKVFTQFVDASCHITTADPLPQGSVGEPYSVKFRSAPKGGNEVWTIVGGTLPPGLTLSSGGTLAGDPTTANVTPYSFDVHVDDGDGGSDTNTFTVLITAGVSIITTDLDDATQYVAYDMLLQSEDGLLPVHWTVLENEGSIGLLPEGLEITDDPDGQSGHIIGESQESGVFPVRLNAQGAAGLSDEQDYLLVVTPRDFFGRSVTVDFDEHVVRVRSGRAG